MRIIFDLRSTGLGDQGGSATLVKSANTLQELGHEVYIVDSMKNQHTWNQLKAKHIIVKNNASIPDADIIIATGYKSVAETRAWETWQMPEKEIINKILKAPTLKLVNSICLQNKLRQFNVDSTIIRPGYDYEEIYPLPKTKEWKNKDFVVLGGLYTEGKHVPIKRPDWIYHVSENLKKKYINVQLFMFGASKTMKAKGVDIYFSNPTMEEKLRFYNQIDIWLAPASQEGLHMPPAEAMMTECPVVATDAPMSGTQDYMINEVNGLVSKNNRKSFLDCVDLLYSDSCYRIRMGREARKQIIKLGSREENMQKMVVYFRSL